jgi:hypothetical protein
MAGSDPKVCYPTVRELDLRLSNERHITDLRFEATEKARALQAKEYERRLAELNHAHQKAVEERGLTVSRVIYEVFLKDNYTPFKTRTEAHMTKVTSYGAAFVFLILAVQIALAVWAMMAR